MPTQKTKLVMSKAQPTGTVQAPDADALPEQPGDAEAEQAEHRAGRPRSRSTRPRGVPALERPRDRLGDGMEVWAPRISGARWSTGSDSETARPAEGSTVWPGRPAIGLLSALCSARSLARRRMRRLLPGIPDLPVRPGQIVDLLFLRPASCHKPRSGARVCQTQGREARPRPNPHPWPLSRPLPPSLTGRGGLRTTAAYC